MERCQSKLKTKEDEVSRLRSSLLTATNQLNQLSKTSAKKQRGTVYMRNDRYFSRWTHVPAKLIAEFQASREEPKTVYLEMRHCALIEPEKLSHNQVVKLIRRYREALPETPSMTVAKAFFAIRLEELRKLELKDTYTRAVLLRQLSSCLNEADACLARNYLENNSKSVPMRELANSVIKNRMQNYLRMTSTKPAEQILPLNHTNRQHMLLHKLAVEEKPLPNAMKAKPGQKRQFQKAKSESPFKKNKNHHNKSFHDNKPKSSSKPFAGAQRPQKQNAGNNRQQQNSRGSNNNQGQSNGKRKSYPETPVEAVEQMKKAYDFTKIADKLQHFGKTTPDIQFMLSQQLKQRDIALAPKEQQ